MGRKSEQRKCQGKAKEKEDDMHRNDLGDSKQKKKQLSKPVVAIWVRMTLSAK